jgi:hypothetical protein
MIKKVIKEITDKLKKVAHVPEQTHTENILNTATEGMESQWPVWGLVLNPTWVQDLHRGNFPCPRDMPDITLPNPPAAAVFQDRYKSQCNNKTKQKQKNSHSCDGAMEI